MIRLRPIALLLACASTTAQDRPPPAPDQPLERLVRGAGTRSFSGIHPHLASFNRSAECGTGALVPWADRLWWVTYAPHKPDGSDDRLYAMTTDRDLWAWPGSIGGTPANRMIHRESQQLFLGPYAIDKTGKVRVIPYSRMRGRPTGNARHLTDPARRIYCATMEEGLYEIDVRDLTVKTLFTDTHDKQRDRESGLPGYHGKGLYSGQGRLVYANNGEAGPLAKTRPDIPSGVLAEWDGTGTTPQAWRVVRRNQFTEVTGPGGLYGNPDPARDPLWSTGWDHRSLLLMVRSTQTAPAGTWHRFRLPKASHSYDGAHGWNTEWPRIRDIGEDDLLMTMHGTFWRFPRSFDIGNTGGLAPRSTYLKIVADFCRWGDQVVFGCDDAAKSEFLNTRRAKGKIAGPAESQSNLWFVAPDRLDRLGPRHGRGGVFVDDPVEADQWSDPMLCAGYRHKAVHLVHDAGQPVRFRFEVDSGNGRFRPAGTVEAGTVEAGTVEVGTVEVGADGYGFHAFAAGLGGSWLRVATDRACRATVWFEFRDADPRSTTRAPRFAGLGAPDGDALGGLLRAGDRRRGLQVLAHRRAADGWRATGYYELRPDLQLVRVESATQAKWMGSRVAIPTGVLRKDGDSILYVDDAGRRWRLPIGNPAFRERPALLDQQRTAREVVTERDLFQCAGTFFELPARNAGGFARIRPVATHGGFVQDYCSWRGLLVLSGVRTDAARDDPHLIWSSDRECAVWLGTVDDLWQLGRPTGRGGPWTDAPVRRGQPSDPYLMAGYDHKRIQLSHRAGTEVRFTLEVDITGAGDWQRYRQVRVAPGATWSEAFPIEFAAYWIRLAADRDCVATARFDYR